MGKHPVTVCSSLLDPQMRTRFCTMSQPGLISSCQPPTVLQLQHWLPQQWEAVLLVGMLRPQAMTAHNASTRMQTLSQPLCMCLPWAAAPHALRQKVHCSPRPMACMSVVGTMPSACTCPRPCPCCSPSVHLCDQQPFLIGWWKAELCVSFRG